MGAHLPLTTMKVLLFAALVSYSYAACPNACSGHGTCNSMDHCTCYGESADDGADKLWRGSDCSLMTCPRGKSWSAVAWDDVTGRSNFDHSDDVECSDGGICDTATGECTCFAGYEGSACQRTVCPNSCSGHGTCRSNSDFAIDFSEAVWKEQTDVDDSILSSPNPATSYYDYFLVTYDDAWDAEMQYGCLCDIGFRGVDCSQVECPTSYDPMDEETCEKYSEWESWGTYVNNQLSLGETGSKYSPSLIGFKGNTILIREWNAPLRGEGMGDASVAATAFHLTIEYNPIEEYPCNGAPAGDYCSGRGICDTGNGICQCFQGFTGPACEEVADTF